MSLDIFSSSSIINTFSALRVVLTIGKHHFVSFTIAMTHVPFVNLGVASEILHSDNQGVGNRGSDALYQDWRFQTKVIYFA